VLRDGRPASGGCLTRLAKTVLAGLLWPAAPTSGPPIAGGPLAGPAEVRRLPGRPACGLPQVRRLPDRPLRPPAPLPAACLRGQGDDAPVGPDGSSASWPHDGHRPMMLPGKPAA
jgi:hypothetical protein